MTVEEKLELEEWYQSSAYKEEAAQDQERAEKQRAWLNTQTPETLLKHFYDNQKVVVALPVFIWGEEAMPPRMREEYSCRASVAHKVNRSEWAIWHLVRAVEKERAELARFIDNYQSSAAYFLLAENVDKVLQREPIAEGVKDYIRGIVNATPYAFKYITPTDPDKPLAAGDEWGITFNGPALIHEANLHADTLISLLRASKTAIAPISLVVCALDISTLINGRVTEGIDLLQKSLGDLRELYVQMIKHLERLCEAYKFDITPAKGELSAAALAKQMPTFTTSAINEEAYKANIQSYYSGMDWEGEGGDNAKYIEAKCEEYLKTHFTKLQIVQHIAATRR